MKNIWKVGLCLNILLTLSLLVLTSGCVGNQIGWNDKTISAEASVSAEMEAKLINNMETVISNNMETIISNIMKELGDVASIKPSADIDIDAEANMKKKEVNKGKK